MKIAVIGTGYVGLVTGTCFAENGNEVTCIDIDANKVNKLKKKEITIYEPGLEVLFKNNINQDRLHFTTDLAKGIQGAKVIFLALPTPPNQDGSADLQHILSVAKSLGGLLTEYSVIVDKSTVPVGTAEKVASIIREQTSVEFDVVSNPEFLREGVAVEDFMKPDRIVIGTSSDRVKEIFYDLYAPFVRQGNPIVFMDERSAELTKYAANSFLATKISFMNEIANLCDKLGADVDMVRKGISNDSRIGKRFLFPGIGYGGSCFPKDVRALVKSGTEVEQEMKILNAVMEVNQEQKTRLIGILTQYFGTNLKNITVCLWGLTFKPYTDDIREAPALENIEMLLKYNANIRVFDPEGMANVERKFKDKITYAKNEYDAAQNADVLMVMTEWPIFRNPDFTKLNTLMKGNLVLDGRNTLSMSKVQGSGFTYYGIGRNSATKSGF